ncbi:MAG: DNA replication/repair protein RecF [Gemmatimonadota bacterium]
MHLKGLSLRHFRNLGVQDLELPPEGVAIVGDNAQGKTNLLEAIYYLETLRSFRGARDGQLVAFGEDVFRVAGEVAGEEGVGVAAAFQRKGRQKKVTLNGREPERLGDALGHLAAVVFSPSDVEMVSGGPGERRRFLDILLSLSRSGYLQTLQEFRRVLARRNAVLKMGGTGGEVAAWNPGLVRTGARLMEARRRWVEERREAYENYFSIISGGEAGTVRYHMSIGAVRDEVPSGIVAEAAVGAPAMDADPEADAGSVEALEERFREALASAAERERRVGATVVGPHRDDLRLTVAEEGQDRSLRDYGSGGQRRTAALALRLVEARTVREVRGKQPVILLDDVFAELDEGRSERILQLLEAEESGQVILTVPKESDIRLRRETLPRWRIREGVVAA